MKWSSCDLGRYRLIIQCVKTMINWIKETQLQKLDVSFVLRGYDSDVFKVNAQFELRYVDHDFDYSNIFEITEP